MINLTEQTIRSNDHLLVTNYLKQSIQKNNQRIQMTPFNNQSLLHINNKYKTDTTQEILEKHFKYIQGSKNNKLRLSQHSDNLSTHNQTNYMTIIKSDGINSVIRAGTTISGKRNFRKNERKRILLNSSNASKNLKTKTQQCNSQIIVEKQVHQINTSSKKLNNFISIEKKNNKGPMKMKHLENWLNDILIEYCYEQKFDTNIMYPALKKFHIDKNSLLSNGININKIERIYRSLFVYSIGFNKLLDELIETNNQNSNIRMMLWKVYAMLLQYCAKGQFETMIGDIERDKNKKLNLMSYQIEKRQKLIQQCQETQKKKNIKIYKELKQLKDKNFALTNQKDIISEDYRQIQQAYNDEVGLRLKFQHKINEMHGIHRQLGIKHMRLFEDFNTLKQQYNKCMQEKRKQISLKEQLMFNILKMQEQKQKLLKKIQDKDNQLQNCQYERFQHLKKIQELQKKNDQRIIYKKQKESEVRFLNFEVNNNKSMLHLKERVVDDQNNQLKILVEQNKQMYQKIEQQRKNIQQIQNNQFTLEVLTRNIRSDLEILQKKYNQKIKQIQKINQLNKNSNLKLMELQNEFYIQKQRNKILLTEVPLYKSVIQQLRKTNINLENQLQLTKKTISQLNFIIQNNQNAQNQLLIKLNSASKEIDNLKTLLLDTQTKIKLQEDNYYHQKALLNKKLDRLKKQYEQLQTSEMQRKKIMLNIEIQNERYKKENSQAKIKLKDQIFERKNIELRFQQSLLEMQDENKYIKQLNIKLSHLNQQKEILRRKLVLEQFNSKNKLEQIEKFVKNLTLQFNKAINQINNKKQWLHPMLFHDIQSILSELTRKYTQLNKNNVQLLRVIEQKNKEIKFFNSKKAGQLDKQKQKIVNEYEMKIFILEKELLFFKQKIQKYRDQAISQSNIIKNYQAFIQQMHTQKQNSLLKQKSQKIQTLINQNQILQDRNSDLNKRILILENQLEKSKQRMSKITQTMKQIQIQKQNAINQKLTIELKFNDIQSNYKIAAQQLKKEKQGIQKKYKFLTQQSLQTKKKSKEKQNMNSLRASRNLLHPNGESLLYDSMKTQQYIKRKEITRKIQQTFNYYNRK